MPETWAGTCVLLQTGCPRVISSCWGTRGTSTALACWSLPLGAFDPTWKVVPPHLMSLCPREQPAHCKTRAIGSAADADTASRGHCLGADPCAQAPSQGESEPPRPPAQPSSSYSAHYSILSAQRERWRGFRKEKTLVFFGPVPHDSPLILVLPRGSLLKRSLATAGLVCTAAKAGGHRAGLRGRHAHPFCLSTGPPRWL